MAAIMELDEQCAPKTVQTQPKSLSANVVPQLVRGRLNTSFKIFKAAPQDLRSGSSTRSKPPPDYFL